MAEYFRGPRNSITTALHYGKCQWVFKEAFRFAEELGLELDLEHPRSVKTEARKCQDEKVEEDVRNQRWQGSLVTSRLQDEKLSAEGCFWWLTEWKTCPTYTIAGFFELYEQLLPTRVHDNNRP